MGVIIPALLAGVVADRVPQRRILLTVAGVEAASMGTAALLAASGVSSIAVLAALAFVSGCAMAFYYPAYSALLPAIVPESELMAVNGLEGMVRPTVGQVLGPAIGGVVVGILAPWAAFGSAALAMALSLLALIAVPRTPLRRTLDPEQAAHPVRSAMSDVAEGWRYMVRTPWLLATLLFACLQILAMMGPLEVLVPVLIKTDLGGGAGDHALVLAGFGIGGALGSLAMASMRMPRRYLSLMLLGWGCSGLPFLVVLGSPGVWTIAACAVVMGALFSAPTVIWGTLLQRRVPPELLGRVSSLDFFVSVALMPVSMAMAGPVADWIGLRTTFVAVALVPAVLAVVAVFAARLPADEIAHPLDRDPEPAPAPAPADSADPDEA